MPEIASAKLSIDPRLLAPGTRVLDVGCGDGRHLRAARERGCSAVGVDYDHEEVRHARASLARDVDLLVADAAHLPFRAVTFDAVICTETLEHLPDDVPALGEMARLLRDGGLLLGAVPSHFTEIVYFMLSRGYRDAPGGHVRIYAPATLFRRLRAAGFALRSVRYLHFVDSLLWLRFCLADALRPRPRTGFEAAVMLAVAQQRETPGWRRTLRRSLGRSRFVTLIDAAGAYIWPKSLSFVAVKSRAEDG